MASVALGAVVMSDAAWAQAKTFNLPAQPAATGVAAFARQADVQVLISANDAQGRRTNPVRGSYPVAQGLRMLLDGTGLEAQATGAQTWSVVARPQGNDGQGEAAAEATVEQLVVTGSRLARNIGDEGPSPVTVFDSEMIESTGVTNVADLLKYLPQQTFSLNEAGQAFGMRTIQLRGLGLGTTLVLLNGRRVVVSAYQAGSTFFDINMVPISAVERVEVLSESASAVYGADAIGGVVNIILKSKADAPSLSLYYGTAEGGAEERRATTALPIEFGRVRGSIIGDWFYRDYLMGEARDLSSNRDFRRFGSSDFRSATANPGNVTSLTTANLPGLSSRFATVPVGSTGVGLRPSDFVATAGAVNLESVARYASIFPRTERRAVAGFLEADVTDGLTAFGELLITNARTEGVTGYPTLLNRRVPASNPYNPFGVDVSVSFLATGAGLATLGAENTIYRWVGGARFELAGWDGEVSYLSTSEKAKGFRRNPLLDTAKVNAALASTDPATALNPFQDGPGGSRQLYDTLRSSALFYPHHSDAQQVSGFARGKLFDLPAGSLNSVVGVEARREAIVFDSRNTGLYVDADRKSGSAFFELDVPLLSANMNLPIVNRLTVRLAGRVDNYSDFGTVFNPQYGLEWIPAEGLLFRASYSTSFRTPALFTLYQPGTGTGSCLCNDPQRGNETVMVALEAGGNPNLKPEEGESFSAGVVLEPSRFPGLRLAATYWEISMDQRFQSLGAVQILAYPNNFPGRIFRAAPTAADTAAGRPGVLQRIDITPVNFGALETSGVDFELSGRFDTSFAAWKYGISATRVSSYSTADVPGQAPLETVGIANLNGSVPRWRGTASGSVTQRAITLSGAVRYISSYKDATAVGVVTGRQVKSQFITDLGVKADLGQLAPSSWAPMDGLELRIGVSNLFDTGLPFSESFGSAGYDISQGDIRGRFGYLSLTKVF